MAIEIKQFEASLSDLKPTEKNPRQISKKDFETLKKSLRQFPEMKSIREVVVDENMRILGGHQRVKALQAIGEATVPVKQVFGLSEDQKDEFIIKDNVANGEWDMDILANLWDKEELEEWGVSLKVASSSDYKELLDVSIPHYTPSEVCPDVSELADTSERDKLLSEIYSLDISDNHLRDLLQVRASFFVDFNFQKIADYYAHSSEEVQSVMKKLGLVIVIPKEAYDLGMCDFRNEVADGE